jgi:hypothetical protein
MPTLFVGHGRRDYPLASLALLLSLSSSALAQSYTSRSSFLAALPGAANTLNFDAVAAGTTFASATGTGGITFTYALGGVLLMVTGAYPAVSGANALGSTDADILQDGDNLTLTFANRNAIGMAIITKEALQNGDLTLSAGGLTATISAGAIQQTLSDGSNVYFLGVIRPTTAFTTATLTTVGGGYFFYNLDDLVSAAATDTDSDGIADGADNCKLIPNGNLIPDAGGHSQLDTDGDGYGNACDADLNNDAIVNFADLALFRQKFGTNDPNTDFNGDGIVNFADLAIFRRMFGKAPGPSGLHP